MSTKAALSKQFIASITPPPAGRDYYLDTECRGLLLQVTANNVRSLQLYRKVAHRPVRLTLGVFDGSIPDARALPSGVKDGDSAAAYITTRPRLSVRQARKLVTLLPSAVTSPTELKRASAAAPTITTVVADYCRLHLAVNCRPGAVERIRWARQRVEDAFGTTKIIDLADEQVARWHTDLVADAGAHTANRALEVLRAAVANGIAKRRLPKTLINPAAGIAAAKEKSRSRFVMPAEVPHLMSRIDALPEHWRDLFHLLLLVGQRRGAVQAMRWSHVDLDGGVWHLPRVDAKNDEDQAVALVPQAVELLRRRFASRSPSPFVFPSESASGHVESPKKAWATVIDGMHREQMQAALAQAGVPVIGEPSYKALKALTRKARIDCPRPDLRPHDLRRTVGSWMAAGGASLQVIGKALGHKSSESTQIYARLQLDAVRQAQAAAVDALMMRAQAR